MPTKKRKPFQPLLKHRTLTGGERERSKTSISWLLALSRNDTEAIMAGLSRDPGLASAVCHLTGLGPVHWAVRHDNKEMVTILIRDCNVSPNMRSRQGYTPLHYAALYNRRELYKELVVIHMADPSIVDFSGLRSDAYLETKLGYGANTRGMTKVRHDLALDVEQHQKHCHQQQQLRSQKNSKQDPKCFEGIKKRHSIGF